MGALNWEPFLCAADNHGDQCDREAVKRFHEFAADWNPKHRIHLGDFLDLRPLRRNASQEERSERIAEDWVAGQTFLEKFRPDTVLFGNHDARIFEALHSNHGMVAEGARRMLEQFQGEAAETPKVGGFLKKIGAKRVLPYHRRKGVYNLGDLRMLHGYASSMYPAAALYRAYGIAICGHVHKYDVHVARHIDGGMAMTSPCLADLNMPYLDRTIAALAHGHGWIYGCVNNRTGKAHFWSVHRGDGETQWIDPRAKWT